MPEREKLLTLIMEATRYAQTFNRYWAGKIAERLLASGMVVVLPCKVGTTVYYADAETGCVQEGKIEYYQIFNGQVWTELHHVCATEELRREDFGKTVFMTRAEAEKALKKMKGNHHA